MSDTPARACYAVIFTSLLGKDDAGYAEAAAEMLQRVRQQPGFLGVESARGEDRVGITVSYWESEEAIRHWRDDAAHSAIRARGRARWYSSFHLTVARVERELRWTKEDPSE